MNNKNRLERRSFRLLKTLLLPALLVSPLMAMAAYPEKPIQLIVPWAAGGGSDAAARGIAAALEEQLKTTINVVNRPGAVVSLGILPWQRPSRMVIRWALLRVN